MTLSEKIEQAKARLFEALRAATKVHSWPPQPNRPEWDYLTQARDELRELEKEAALDGGR